MYAPTQHFEMTAHAGSLVGYAAPTSGRWPAGVELWGDDRLIAAVAATGFSQQASSDGWRHGWCGFTIEGAGEGFAIASNCRLRCSASGTVLATLAVDQLRGPTTITPRLSLAEMLAHVRAADCAATVEQILPFALSFSRRVGVGEFVEKTCTMLLHRFVDFGSAKLLAGLTGEEDPYTILELIAATVEIEESAFAYIPGPFHPEFLYGHDAFG